MNAHLQLHQVDCTSALQASDKGAQLAVEGFALLSIVKLKLKLQAGHAQL